MTGFNGNAWLPIVLQKQKACAESEAPKQNVVSARYPCNACGIDRMDRENNRGKKRINSPDAKPAQQGKKKQAGKGMEQAVD